MKVLITGGTGFIGCCLALKCLEAGYKVTVLGQENKPAEKHNRHLLEAKGVKVYLASITDKTRVEESVQGADLVYHLAATQHEMNVPDQRFWDVNVNGTQNILEASARARVRLFVHGSTIAVYGAPLKGGIDEESPLRPDNIYGVTKLQGEKTALAFREKLPVTIVRISETYGPGDYRLLKLFKAIKASAFVMIGDGTNTHHVIYIDDLLSGLLLVPTVKAAKGEIFVLAGKDIVTTAEMIEVIASQLRAQTWRFRVPFHPVYGLATIVETALRPLRIHPPLHRRRLDFFKKSFSFSQEKPKRLLGFTPRVSFPKGVAETINWYVSKQYL